MSHVRPYGKAQRREAWGEPPTDAVSSMIHPRQTPPPVQRLLTPWGYLAMAMIAAPTKMNAPPRMTDGCRWPPKNKVEKIATNSG